MDFPPELLDFGSTQSRHYRQVRMATDGGGDRPLTIMPNGATLKV